MRTTAEYFNEKLSGLDSATRLVVAFDPEERLDVSGPLTDDTGRCWQGIVYRGNDLELRVALQKKEMQGKPLVLVVPPPRVRRSDYIDVSTIADLIAQADVWLDLSTMGVLKSFWPKETFPPDVIERYQDRIAADLSRFRHAFEDYRQELGDNSPLTAAHVKAVLLKMEHPGLTRRDLRFVETRTAELLAHYLRLVTEGWSEVESELLREIVQDTARIDCNGLKAWLTTPPSEIARYLLLRDFFARQGVQNPELQLRGVGAIDVEPDDFGPHTAAVTVLLKKQPGAWMRLAELAEKDLDTERLYAAVGSLLPGADMAALGRMIKNEEHSAALIEALSRRALHLYLDAKPASGLDWAASLHSHPLFERKPADETEDTTLNRAQQQLLILGALAFITQKLAVPWPECKTFDEILDQYAKSKVWRLELAVARVRKCGQAVKERALREKLSDHVDALRVRVRDHLDCADHNLADLIKAQTGPYLNHPRSLTKVIYRYLRKSLGGKKTPVSGRVWMLVFDGMRYDSWQEVIKPILQSEYEIVAEDINFTALPSITPISRTALLAGRQADQFKDFKHKPTKNEAVLAAKNLGLSESEVDSRLMFVTDAEAEKGQRKLGFDAADYNVLIYNLSDNWVHTFKGDVRELNDHIAQKLQKDIMPDLRHRIAEGDRVIIGSDHGFVELFDDEECKEVIPESVVPTPPSNVKNPEHPVRARYLKRMSFHDTVPVTYDKVSYSMPVGKRWFAREDSRGFNERYTHGGISLAECLVASALLKRISKPLIKLVLRVVTELTVTEDEPTTLRIEIANEGNRPGQYELEALGPGIEKKTFGGTVEPRTEETLRYEFVPTLATKTIKLKLRYETIEGKEKVESRTVSVTVKPTNKVEIDFSGLAAFDEV